MALSSLIDSMAFSSLIDSSLIDIVKNEVVDPLSDAVVSPRKFLEQCNPDPLLGTACRPVRLWDMSQNKHRDLHPQCLTDSRGHSRCAFEKASPMNIVYDGEGGYETHRSFFSATNDRIDPRNCEKLPVDPDNDAGCTLNPMFHNWCQLKSQGYGGDILACPQQYKYDELPDIETCVLYKTVGATDTGEILVDGCNNDRPPW